MPALRPAHNHGGVPPPGVAYPRFHPVQSVAGVFPLPVRHIVDVQGACLVQFLAAPLGIVGRWCFRLFKATALPLAPGAPLVLADIPHKAFNAAVVNIQVFTPGKADLPGLVCP